MKLRRLLVRCYPSLHASYEGVFFIYQWAYLLGFKHYYSPLLHLSKTVLRRLTQQDLVRLFLRLSVCPFSVLSRFP